MAKKITKLHTRTSKSGTKYYYDVSLSTGKKTRISKKKAHQKY